MSADPATKRDLEQVESRLEQRIGTVESRLEQRIDTVESRLEQRIDTVESRLEQKIDAVESRLEQKIDIVARQVAWLTEEMSAIRADMVTRADLVAFREDVGQEIARHMKAGFEMMKQMFAAQDDRARSIEDKHSVLHRDFTEHAQDFVLHNKP